MHGPLAPSNDFFSVFPCGDVPRLRRGELDVHAARRPRQSMVYFVKKQSLMHVKELGTEEDTMYLHTFIGINARVCYFSWFNMCHTSD